MLTRRRLLLALGSLALLASSAGAGTDEGQRIEALLHHLEGLKGARFIRNGTSYDAATAAGYLRGKWQRHSETIKTAEQFIEELVSRSSASGKPYLIRFSDGREVPTGEYLREVLKSL